MLNSILRRFLDNYKPDYVAAVWEGHGPTFRDRIFPDYKANRDAMPEDLSIQLPYIKRLLAAWNMPVLSEDGFEADDTIGLLASQAVSHGIDVWIVSKDKDLMQLVRPGVSLLDPFGNKRYRTLDVKSFLGVEPGHVADFLALKGDKVDNIPGAPGIGDKGAQQLIRQYGDIEGIISHAEEVGRKPYRESLQKNADQIRLSKRLATLATDGSVQFDPEAAKSSQPDSSRLLELYSELEFNSLASELRASTESPEPDFEVETFGTEEKVRDWLRGTNGAIAMATLDSKQREAKRPRALGSARRGRSPGGSRQT